MADLKISELSALAGVDLAATDQLAVADSSASETKRITVTDLVGNATTLIADSTIPGAKILFSAGDIAGTAIADGGVDTDQLAADGVTAAKLADESTVDLVTALPASGAFVGQIALDTDDDKIYCWDGSQWVSIKAAGSVNTVVGGSAGIVNVTVTVSGDEVTINTTLDDTSAAAQFLAGPTSAAGAVSYRAIAGTDLPTASSSAKGGVQVDGDGLRMDTSKIEIDNDITASGGTFKLVDVNAKGLVVNTKDVESSDIPVATDSTAGAVSPGTDLEVTGVGVLNHEVKVAGGGTFTKVTITNTGHVNAGTTLDAADIPDLEASKVTSGTFATARIGDASVTGPKLANYAVSKFGETQPTADHIGQFFFNPLTRDLFLWDGNVFQPVGISAGEIVFAGTYDASTNLIDSTTADGTAAGFTTGQALPSPSATNNKYYVVVSSSGTGTSPAPTVALEPPDILLSNGTNFILIDTSETVTAQLASNIEFTPTGNIASVTVQSAIAEVDNEKVAKAGDTMTGNLQLADGVKIIFEGATDNEFETTLTVTDPTADRTITLPNVSGTVVTTGDTGSVTSAMISNGTIVNADINASAAIAVSKLASGSAGQIVQTDAGGTAVEFSSTANLPRGTASAPAYSFEADGNTGIYSPGADQVAVATNGTGRLFVDSSGNVGIGTSSPEEKLHIQAGANSSIRLGQTGGNFAYRLRANVSSSVNGGFLIQDAVSGNDLYRTDSGPSGSHRFYIDDSEKVRITPTGNVGIGTSTPDAVLDVRKDGTGQNLQIWRSDLGTNDRNLILESPNSDSGSEPFYFSTGNSLAVKLDGSERVRIDHNGDVGIGTSSPGYPLTIAGTNPQIGIPDGVGNAVTIGVPQGGAGQGNLTITGVASQNITFNSPTSEFVRIDSAGNVGIGTTNPGDRLHVAGNILQSNNKGLYGLNTDGSTSMRLLHLGSDNNAYVNSHTTTSNELILKRGSAESARIDSSGRLLVGTSSVITGVTGYNDGTLQVSNNTSGQGGAAGLVAFAWDNGSGPNDAPIIQLNKSLSPTRGTHVIVNDGNTLGSLVFGGSDGTNFEQAARIGAEVDGTPGTNDMPGRLVFSTTADGASSPTERMRISSNGVININATGNPWQATGNNPKVQIEAGRVSAANYQSSTFTANRTGSDGSVFDFYREAVFVGSISVTASATAYNTSSDYRLKENVTPVTDGITRLQQLKPSRFNFIADPSTVVDGFIAHEVQTVVPEAITGEKDAVDDEGNPQYQGIDQSKLVPLLTAALQEAIGEIESLKARVAALESA